MKSFLRLNYYLCPISPPLFRPVLRKIQIKPWWEQIGRPGANTKPTFAFQTPANSPECQRQPWTRWNAQHLRSHRDQETQSDLGKSMKQQRVTASQPAFILRACLCSGSGSTECRQSNKCDRWEDENAFKSFPPSAVEVKKKTACGEAAACPQGARSARLCFYVSIN